MAYKNYQSVVINHSKCGASDSTNFPMLFQMQSKSFATVGNGGLIQNTVAQSGGGSSVTVPADFIFTSDAAGTTKLNFEWEAYTATTGAVLVWVMIPTLSHTTDTTIYIYFNDTTVSTYQGAVNATWNSNFNNVYHLPNGASLSLVDSTVNANTMTGTGTPTATDGIIDGGMKTTGTAQYASATVSKTSNTARTVSFWFNSASISNIQQGIFSWATTNNSGTPFLLIAQDSQPASTVGINRLLFFADGGYRRFDVTIVPGLWYFVFAIYDGAGNWKFGVNTSIQSNALTNPAANLAGATTIYASSGFNVIWNGMFDELHIVNTNLSVDWMLAEYNNQSSPSTFYKTGATITF